MQILTILRCCFFLGVNVISFFMYRSRFCGLSSPKRSTNDFLCILKCGCPTPSSGRNLCRRERGCFKWMCVDQVHLHAYITFEDYTIFKNLATSLRNLNPTDPWRNQWITWNVFWISLYPDWQIDNGFLNRPIMARTHILVHRWGPRTRISALFRRRT